jgi:DNA modification methylase
MKPYYKNELTTIYNGDCLEVMDYLIEQGVKVDAIITDPPYLHVKGGMKSKRINTGSYSVDSHVNTKMRDFDEKNIYNILNKSKLIFNGSFNGYFFCSKLQIVSYLKWCQENKLNYDLLIWDRLKKSMISTKFYTSNIDYVIRIYGKGRALNKIINTFGKGDITFYNKIQSYQHPKDWKHETEKPIELIKKYILLSTNENDIVLDCFSGSFTTCSASEQLNRRSIGIELEQKYCDIGVKRLSQLQMRLEI